MLSHKRMGTLTPALTIFLGVIFDLWTSASSSIIRRSTDGCHHQLIHVGGETFRVVTEERVTWDQGVAWCNGEGATLARPVDLEAFIGHLKDHLSTCYDSSSQWEFFVGGQNRANRSVWRDACGSLIPRPWKEKVPNVTQGSCLIIKDGHLASGQCDDYRMFVCQSE